jgi:signal transduction histidine kinase
MYLLVAGLVHRRRNSRDGRERALRRQVAELARLHERVRHAASQMTPLHERVLRRIGAQLYDGPMQDLALGLLRFDTPGRRDSDGTPASLDMPAIQAAIQEALGELRAIASGLRLPALESLSTTEVVAHAVDDHERRSGTRVVLHLEHLPEHAPLAVKIALARALQEALSNATRHGGGNNVITRVWADTRYLSLVVSDAGPGFDPSTVDPLCHLGLQDMRERAELLGGSFQIRSASGQGTSLRMCWSLRDFTHLCSAQHDNRLGSF